MSDEFKQVQKTRNEEIQLQYHKNFSAFGNVCFSNENLQTKKLIEQQYKQDQNINKFQKLGQIANTIIQEGNQRERQLFFSHMPQYDNTTTFLKNNIMNSPYDERNGNEAELRENSIETGQNIHFPPLSQFKQKEIKSEYFIAPAQPTPQQKSDFQSKIGKMAHPSMQLFSSINKKQRKNTNHLASQIQDSDQKTLGRVFNKQPKTETIFTSQLSCQLTPVNTSYHNIHNHIINKSSINMENLSVKDEHKIQLEDLKADFEDDCDDINDDTPYFGNQNSSSATLPRPMGTTLPDSETPKIEKLKIGSNHNADQNQNFNLQPHSYFNKSSSYNNQLIPDFSDANHLYMRKASPIRPITSDSVSEIQVKILNYNEYPCFNLKIEVLSVLSMQESMKEYQIEPQSTISAFIQQKNLHSALEKFSESSFYIVRFSQVMIRKNKEVIIFVENFEQSIL